MSPIKIGISLLSLAVTGWTLPVHAQTALPRFVTAGCPFAVGQGLVEGQDVRCGYLLVPENRAVAGSPTIRLAVAIYRSPSDRRAPDPLIDLEGGPGGSALKFWGSVLDISTRAIILGDRDLVLLDQRGTGFSQPSLACPEFEKSQSRTLTPSRQRSSDLLAVRQCRQRLVSAGVDLNAYTTDENAADVADLRLALGYDRINLYGSSYGTRLALTVMRAAPDGIRSVILDSVVPTQSNLFLDAPGNEAGAFALLFKRCAASPRCSRAHPHLKQVFYRLADRLNARPVTVTIASAAGDRSSRLRVDGPVLAGAVHLLLFSSNAAAAPGLIDQASAGHYGPIARLFGSAPDIAGIVSWGMYFSVECSEDLAFTSPAKLRLATRVLPASIRSSVGALLSEAPAWCAIWNVRALPAAQKEPVSSPIPALVLEGQYDPNTPPAGGRLAAETLTHSYFFTFPGLGHGVRFAGLCPLGIATSFLQNPVVEPNPNCIASMTAYP